MENYRPNVWYEWVTIWWCSWLVFPAFKFNWIELYLQKRRTQKRATAHNWPEHFAFRHWFGAFFFLSYVSIWCCVRFILPDQVFRHLIRCIFRVHVHEITAMKESERKKNVWLNPCSIIRFKCAHLRCFFTQCFVSFFFFISVVVLCFCFGHLSLACN